MVVLCQNLVCGKDDRTVRRENKAILSVCAGGLADEDIALPYIGICAGCLEKKLRREGFGVCGGHRALGIAYRRLGAHLCRQSGDD